MADSFLTKFKPKLLLYESLLFLLVQSLALFAGAKLIKAGQVELPTIEGGYFRLVQILIAFVIALVIMIILLKLLKTPLSFGFFFSLIIFIGAQAIFEAFFPLIISIALAVAIVLIRWKFPNVVTHNLAIILGIAGISMVLGLSLRPWPEIIILLIALSIYDFIAVFKTKFMVSLFKQLLTRGAPLAIVVPERAPALKEHIGKISAEKIREKDKKVLMLGSGDIAFPTLFAVSAQFANGLPAAIAIIAGSIIGIIANHYLLTIKKFKFIPALPLIAAFSITAYLLSLGLT